MSLSLFFVSQTLNHGYRRKPCISISRCGTLWTNWQANPPSREAAAWLPLPGALGAALVSMVANLTLGKEKYKDVQPQVEALLKESEKLRSDMQDLIQKDTEAYGALSQVYKMPKNTDAEKAARTAKMQEALKKACQVPFEIGLKSLEVAKARGTRRRYRQCRAVSDAGVAVLLAQACAQSAALNVKINVNSIKDEAYNKETWTRMQDVLTKVAALEKSVMATTYKKMG